MFRWVKATFRTDDGFWELIRYVETTKISTRWVRRREAKNKAKLIHRKEVVAIFKPRKRKYRIWMRKGRVIFKDKPRNPIDIKTFLITAFSRCPYDDNETVYSLRINAQTLRIELRHYENTNRVSPQLTREELLEKIRNLKLSKIRFYNYKICPDDIAFLFTEFAKVFDT